MSNYIIKQGDCLSSIAFKHGFRWKTLWNHANNANLKKRSNDPNIIFPGDTVFIPDKDEKWEACNTGKRHSFVKKGDPKDLDIILIREQYDMIELVEVIEQDKEKWVKGAAMATTAMPDSVERKAKDGDTYKQYINLKQDIEGKPKRHPEYGRKVLFKARIKQTKGEKKLDDISVKLSYKKTDGPNKTLANIWDESKLTGSQKQGFGSAGGSETQVVKTDAKGWTSAVSFYLSEYGGDKFEIKAELDPATPGASSAKTVKTAANYIVWRKFWYQLTYADGFSAKDPTKAETAYEEVFAEMIKSGEKKFTKDDLPDDLKKRTFYKEYMFKKAGGNKVVATIGGNNKTEFTKKAIYDKDKPKKHPLKANLIVCEYQCDPKPACALGKFALSSSSQEIIMSEGTGGSIICKPALKAGAKLIAIGEWSKTLTPWAKEGNISDASIEINPGRDSTLKVKVDLSKTTGAPTPTPVKNIYIKLKVRTAEGYLGESFGKGQILCVYRPGTAAGKQGSEADYNDTVAHELGHMWNQTPKSANKPASLKAHPFQYVGHGGSGSHCREGVAGYVKADGFLHNTPGPVDWTNSAQKTPSPYEGKCLMYHSFSTKCTHKFCTTCKPYLQLQDMSSL